MYCTKCGKPVSNTAFYCQWCGAELVQPDTEWMIEKIKTLRQKPREVEAAKYIAKLWESGAYKDKYDSFDAFAAENINMEKSIAFKTKDVGLKFFDNDGRPLLPNLEEWGIGKLTQLLSLSVDEICFWQENGLLDPQMTSADLAEFMKEYRKVKKEN